MTTPEDHLARVRRLAEGFDLLFSAICSSSHEGWLKRSRSSWLGSSRTLRRMSSILDEYDEEVHGEQEKGFCARVFKTKQIHGTVNAGASVFHYEEKESYAKIFSIIDVDKKRQVSRLQFNAFLRSVGFSDEIGLDFACSAFQLLDLDGSGNVDLDEFIAFSKISRHMPETRRPIIKFYDFVDVNQDQSVEISELDSALSYLALPPLRDSDREKISALCNDDDELEFEVSKDSVECVSFHHSNANKPNRCRPL
jgi:Ca2+-binding EF-hand superfamily protein